MRVAVTGGDGFIGTAVVHTLKEADHDPVVLDRSTGLDIRNAAELVERLDGCDGVIHLAGVLGTDKLFGQERLAIESNVIGTQNVLDAAVAVGARYVGVTMPSAFWGIYTVTKTCAKGLATAAHRAAGLPVSHVRAFNAFGPGQSIAQNKMIPNFACAAWAGEPLPIYGDGTQTVDLVHVDDVARMLVAALDFGDDQVFDAGTGAALSVNDVADLVLAITGSTAGVTFLPMRLGEDPSRIVATGEGWAELGWQPTVTAQRLAETIRSYRP